jgi:hypothetical protein
MYRLNTRAPLLALATALFGCARANPGAVAITPAPINFAGVWRLDSAKTSAVGGGTGTGRGGGGGNGGGIGMGPAPDSLTVLQNTLNLTFVQSRGATTSRVTFLLNGREMANPIGTGGGARQGVYVSAWVESRLVTTITAPAAKGSTTIVTYQDVRYIDASGELVVEISIPGRPNSRRVVYTRLK